MKCLVHTNVFSMITYPVYNCEPSLYTYRIQAVLSTLKHLNDPEANANSGYVFTCNRWQVVVLQFCKHVHSGLLLEFVQAQNSVHTEYT